jgi:Holliday junction resolvase RusA-like endonuclease
MQIYLHMEPIPKARARTVINHGRVMSFTPKPTAEAEAAIRMQISRSNEYFGKGVPLSVSLTFYVTKPPSVPKKRSFPITRPDIDNYTKLVLDACNKFLWADDSQICELKAVKKYDGKPGILIVAQPICNEGER